MISIHISYFDKGFILMFLSYRQKFCQRLHGKCSHESSWIQSLFMLHNIMTSTRWKCKVSVTLQGRAVLWKKSICILRRWEKKNVRVHNGMFVVVVRTHFCLQISKGNGKMVPWSNFKQITDILQKQCFDILWILLPKTEIKVWKFSSWKITAEKSCFTRFRSLGL